MAPISAGHARSWSLRPAMVSQDGESEAMIGIRSSVVAPVLDEREGAGWLDARGDVRPRYAELGDGGFILSRQVNFETIHNHKVLAEQFGTVAELRAELIGGEPAPQHTQLREWLA